MSKKSDFLARMAAARSKKKMPSNDSPKNDKKNLIKTGPSKKFMSNFGK